ncbi:MAG: radical SAM family heme chaperone HemW [Chloroflexaceae bacterium]|jgi:oxygen-independent coproporphyrinogen-3 oxidase|nr:radical SAM family heme chaperone HemW [Chloroflexaceae bacterium]
MRHLYLHIPFCARRCSYCDFNTYANMEDRIEAYVQALCDELRMLTADRGRETEDRGQAGEMTFLPGSASVSGLRSSVFFGGGTPSMLTLDQFERVLAAAERLVPLAGAEVTIEANPGSVLGNDTPALEYLRGLRALGINRLSFGVQSLHDPTLRILGRTHNAADARRCLETAREAGFDNINLDFMFGLPGQSQQQWEATLDEIVTWGADHFSLYSLILEEKTPLYAQVLGGRVSVPDDDATAAMYEAAMGRFAAAGYVQYEISNWAQQLAASSLQSAVSGSELQTANWQLQTVKVCHHNLAYWYNLDYLAAGAGAHGHVYPQRYHDILGIDDYIRAVRAGQRPLAEVVDLSHADLCAETMFMGLRLNSGVSRAHFLARCGAALDATYGKTLAELVGLGLLADDGDSVRLTAQGRMLGNQVFERFV